MSKKSTSAGVGKKVLASALSAAMVVAFAPVAAMAETVPVDRTVSQAEDSNADASGTVAVVGTNAYESLGEAIGAADAGSTVVLQKDISLADQIRISKNAVIDLNGKTITYTGTKTLFSINASTNLSIKDSDGDGTISSASSALVYVAATASFSLNGGVLKRSSMSDAKSAYVVSIAQNASAQINGGVILAEGVKAKTVIDMGKGATLDLDGGLVKNRVSNISKGVIYLYGATANLKSGKVSTGTAYGIYMQKNSSTYPTLIIGKPGSAADDLDISAKDDVVHCDSISSANLHLTIYSGTLNGDVGSSALIDDALQQSIKTMNGEGGLRFTGDNIAKAVRTLGANIGDRDGEGFYSIGSASVPVAQVGSDTYLSIEDAINNAQNGTIVTLLSDLSELDTIFVRAGKAVSVDLAGHTIAFAPNKSFTVNNGRLDLLGTGEVKSSHQKNSSDYLSTIYIVGSSDDVSNYSVVNVGKGVTVENEGSYGIGIVGPDENGAVAYGAKLTLDGKIVAPYGFTVNGKVRATSGAIPEVSIGSTGSIVSTSATDSGALYAAGYAKYDVQGFLVGVESGIEIRAGMLDIGKNASVEATGAFSDPAPNGNGSTVKGAALAVSQHATNLPIEVKISGGSLAATGANGKSIYEIDTVVNEVAEDVAKEVSIEISGGKFSQDIYSTNNKIHITGGVYSANPSDYVANGHAAVVNADASRYVVTAAANVNANKKLIAGTFSEDMSSYMSSDCYEYAMHDGKTFVVKAKDAAAPANTSGYQWDAADANGVRSEVAIPYTPSAPVTPKPEPAPVAPGTDVSGADSAGNTVEATVTDNNKTTLPDGTEAAGSVEFKGTTSGSGSSEPAKSIDVPATVTANGSTYVVTKIADEAFAGQGQLESVSIPETIVEIGSKAFAGTSISKVVIPAATSTIGAGVFQGCKELESVDIRSAALTNIPADAFNGTSLGSIDIPSTVTSIGARAFKGTKLTSVELPKAVTAIEEGTFQNCSELASVAGSAKTVAKSAFAGCSFLKTVSLPKATEVGAYAFSGTALKTVSLPKAEVIGANAFKNAAKLKTLATGAKLKGIGSKALAGAKNLKVLTVTSKKLTKKGVKNSLKGSSVKRVEVAVSGSKSTLSKYVAKYGKIFKKSNSGKSVSVVPAKKKQK